MSGDLTVTVIGLEPSTLEVVAKFPSLLASVRETVPAIAPPDNVTVAPTGALMVRSISVKGALAPEEISAVSLLPFTVPVAAKPAASVAVKPVMAVLVPSMTIFKTYSRL